MAIQGAANSRHRRDQQIHFTGLDSPDASRVDVNKFGQALLSHTEGRANAPNIAAQLAKIAGYF